VNTGGSESEFAATVEWNVFEYLKYKKLKVMTTHSIDSSVGGNRLSVNEFRFHLPKDIEETLHSLGEAMKTKIAKRPNSDYTYSWLSEPVQVNDDNPDLKMIIEYSVPKRDNPNEWAATIYVYNEFDHPIGYAWLDVTLKLSIDSISLNPNDAWRIPNFHQKGYMQLEYYHNPDSQSKKEVNVFGSIRFYALR